jgi:FkbM family methyltransferase
MIKTIKYKDHDITFYDLLESGHNIDHNIIADDLYTRPDHRFSEVTSLLNKGSVVYDIGAYIGTFSIPLEIEGMEVYAFEGFPDNYKRLEKNTKPYKNIKVHLVSVSNENKSIKTQFNSCMAQKENPYREINYRVFDDYIQEHNIPNPDYVKIDIEGMETLALYGMKNLLENIRPIFQIGYHFGIDESLDGYPGFVSVSDGGFDFNSFTDLNYKVTPNLFEGWGEYLCIPNENI